MLWFTGSYLQSDDLKMMFEFHIARPRRPSYTMSRTSASLEASSFPDQISTFDADSNGHIEHVVIRDSAHYFPFDSSAPEQRQVARLLSAVEFPHVRSVTLESTSRRENGLAVGNGDGDGDGDGTISMERKKRMHKTWKEAYEMNLIALEQKETLVDSDVPISPLWVSPWHRAMCERW